MPSALDRAEAALAKAEAAYEPLQAALEEAQLRQLTDYVRNRQAILDAIAKRDPARIKVMEAQDKLADLRAAEGLQPPTIGKANRG